MHPPFARVSGLVVPVAMFLRRLRAKPVEDELARHPSLNHPGEIQSLNHPGEIHNDMPPMLRVMHTPSEVFFDTSQCTASVHLWGDGREQSQLPATSQFGEMRCTSLHCDAACTRRPALGIIGLYRDDGSNRAMDIAHSGPLAGGGWKLSSSPPLAEAEQPTSRVLVPHASVNTSHVLPLHFDLGHQVNFEQHNSLGLGVGTLIKAGPSAALGMATLNTIWCVGLCHANSSSICGCSEEELRNTSKAESRMSWLSKLFS